MRAPAEYGIEYACVFFDDAVRQDDAFLDARAHADNHVRADAHIWTDFCRLEKHDYK